MMPLLSKTSRCLSLGVATISFSVGLDLIAADATKNSTFVPENRTAAQNLSSNILLRFWRTPEVTRPVILDRYTNALWTISNDTNLMSKLSEIFKRPNSSIRVITVSQLEQLGSNEGPLASITGPSQRSELVKQITPSSESLGFFLKIPLRESSKPDMEILGIGVAESLLTDKNFNSWFLVGNLYFQLLQHAENHSRLTKKEQPFPDSQKRAYRATAVYLGQQRDGGTLKGSELEKLQQAHARFLELAK